MGQHAPLVMTASPGFKIRGVQLGHLIAAIYTRVSTADQNCDRQVGDLEAFAARAVYEVVRVWPQVPWLECGFAVNGQANSCDRSIHTHNGSCEYGTHTQRVCF